METRVKPHLRGVLHQEAAWFSLGAGSVLVAMAHTLEAAVAAAIYSASLVAQFAVSSIYHRVQWTERMRALLRRADHSAIFVLIAGTYTPISLLGLAGDDGRRLLIIIWAGAAAGVALSLFWINAPKVLVAVLAVALGWTIVPYFDQARQLLGAGIWLVLAGGIAYTAGAIVYAARRPDPHPHVFGYHEVFHVLTIVGAFLHFAAILGIVRNAA
ncbi:MAG TPA: hemolysin III family protein [Thermoanaerobaculia bacterium]|nr:hemolysin III family protein [Thermoanaerobaculia bacterium]